jgi:hypothetical protein
LEVKGAALLLGGNRSGPGWEAWTSSNTSLERQPLVALFLTIAIGYLLRERGVVRGLSLGVGMVLFVAGRMVVVFGAERF